VDGNPSNNEDQQMKNGEFDRLGVNDDYGNDGERERPRLSFPFDVEKQLRTSSNNTYLQIIMTAYLH
jgi:hypothetical protein